MGTRVARWYASEIKPGTTDPEEPDTEITPGWYINAIDPDADPDSAVLVQLCVDFALDGDGNDIAEQVAHRTATILDGFASLSASIGLVSA